MLRVFTYLLIAISMIAISIFIGWWQVDGPGTKAPASTIPVSLTQMEFSLKDHENNQVSARSLLGKPAMVFFGFTYCPDICPTTLENISRWLDELGPDAEKFNAILVSVDPERDTPKVLAEYISYFHPMIRGWTGSLTELDKMMAGFAAKYERVPLGKDDYTINHSAGVYLFAEDGSFVSIIDSHEDAKMALTKIHRAIKSP